MAMSEDLDEVLLMVGQVAPNRPIAVVGFSCGSGFAGRYGALRSHLSAWKDEPWRTSEKWVRGFKRIIEFFSSETDLR